MDYRRPLYVVCVLSMLKRCGPARKPSLFAALTLGLTMLEGGADPKPALPEAPRVSVRILRRGLKYPRFQDSGPKCQ